MPPLLCGEEKAITVMKTCKLYVSGIKDACRVLSVNCATSLADLNRCEHLIASGHASASDIKDYARFPLNECQTSCLSGCIETMHLRSLFFYYHQ
jgi:hypothetical protein